MGKKMLIVYYSVSNGNTKRIAEQLQKATGADIARIETTTPYSGSYNDIVEQGQREVNRGYQPEIKPLKRNPADYDVVAVGTPTWWYTMAPAVLSFLKSCDWTGKTVILFQTHGGWPGHVIEDIKSVCKGANFSCEMEIQFDGAGGAELVTWDKNIEAWIAQIRKEIEMKPEEVSVFPVGGKNDAFAKYFVGQSYLNMLTTDGVVIGNVTFEPGCRNNWHIHHAKNGGGQILLCTAGRGYYQEWGKGAQELHPGDVVVIPAGVKHWHGATADSWFAHLAVEVPGEETATEWCEVVSNEAYIALK